MATAASAAAPEAEKNFLRFMKAILTRGDGAGMLVVCGWELIAGTVPAVEKASERPGRAVRPHMAWTVWPTYCIVK